MVVIVSFESELQATSHFVFFWSFLYPFNVIISPIWTRFFIYQRIVSLNTYANTEFSNAQSSGPQTGAPRKESLTVPVTVTSESQAPLISPHLISYLSSHLTSPPTSSKETSEILQEAVLKLQSSSVNINHPHHHLHHLH